MFSDINEWACHFKENKQYLLPMIKFKFQEKIRIFWKNRIYQEEPDNFPILKEFSDELGDNINECNFFYTL